MLPDFVPRSPSATNALTWIAAILVLVATPVVFLWFTTIREEKRGRSSAPGATPPRDGPGLLERKESDVADDGWADQIESWKWLMFTGLGFSADDCLQLMKDPNVDWHEAKELLENGYTHQQVIWKLERVN